MDFSLATLPVETALIFWTFWTWAMDCMLYVYIFMSVFMTEIAPLTLLFRIFFLCWVM